MKLNFRIICCFLLLTTKALAFQEINTDNLSSYLSKQQMAFVQTLMPAIQLANEKISSERDKLLKLHARWLTKQLLSNTDKKWIFALAKYYDIQNIDFKDQQFWQKLERRVNTLPVSLILAQAINESGWGRSRFAKQGLNFFGQWCYKPGCGIIPAERPQGLIYEVKRFATLQSSVNSYLRNMNVNKAYVRLRKIRQLSSQLAKKQKSLDLVQGLTNYSSRGEQYVQSIRKIILRYHLTMLDV